MTPQDPVASLAEALGSGAARIVDLTQLLGESTPVIQLPEQFAQTPPLKRHEISHYDERGPAWAWYWLEIGEHTGTHLDAPIHWISGREGIDVSQVPPGHLIAPAVVIDRSAQSADDPDYLLTVDDIHAFEEDHGPLPEGGWLLLHTGWDARAHDAEAFLNAQDGNPRSPGPDAECARWSQRRAPSSASGWRPSESTRAPPAGSIPPSPPTTTSWARTSTVSRSSRTWARCHQRA